MTLFRWLRKHALPLGLLSIALMLGAVGSDIYLQLARATVSSTVSRIEYTGNGSLTTYAYPFRIFADADLEVYVASVKKTLTTDYTVTGADAVGGGNVVFVVAPASGASIVILRNLIASQPVDLVAQGPMPAETLEKAYDRAIIGIQQHDETLRRVLAFSKSSLLKDPILPDGVVAKLLRWKTNTELENVDKNDLNLTLSEQNILAGFTKAGFPAAGTAGRMARVTDGLTTDNVVEDNGSNWRSTFSRSTRIAVVTDPQFGARGDGSTDDRQAVVDALATSDVVYFPSPASGSFYAVSSPVLVPRDNMTIFGSGFSTEIRPTGTASGIFDLTGRAGVKIIDLAFRVTTTTTPYRHVLLGPAALYNRLDHLLLLGSAIRSGQVAVEFTSDATNGAHWNRLHHLEVATLDIGIRADSATGGKNANIVTNSRIANVNKGMILGGATGAANGWFVDMAAIGGLVTTIEFGDAGEFNRIRFRADSQDGTILDFKTGSTGNMVEVMYDNPAARTVTDNGTNNTIREINGSNLSGSNPLWRLRQLLALGSVTNTTGAAPGDLVLPSLDQVWWTTAEASGTPQVSMRGTHKTIANDGTLSINYASSGFVFITAQPVATVHEYGIYAFNDTAGSTTEISDPAGVFTPTSGTTTSINVFVSGGNLVIENKRGASREVHVWMMARR